MLWMNTVVFTTFSMEDKLRAFIDTLFEDAPAGKKAVELKEEMLQNLNDKYNDLLSEGKSEEAAYNLAVLSKKSFL